MSSPLKSHVFSNQSLAAPIEVEPGLVAFTRGNLENSGPNEDSVGVFFLRPDYVVLAVADGAGGHPLGEEASRICIEKLGEALGDVTDPQNQTRVAILDVFENANFHLLNEKKGSKTTFTVVEVTPDFARFYHVGDSGAFLCSNRGQVRYKTTFHSPVGYRIESGDVGERAAMAEPDRHLVSNLMGTQDVKIEVSALIEVQKYDRIFLASDGVFDNCSSQSLADALSNQSSDKAAEEIVERVRHAVETGTHGKPDDVSFILLQHKDLSDSEKPN